MLNVYRGFKIFYLEIFGVNFFIFIILKADQVVKVCSLPGRLPPVTLRIFLVVASNMKARHANAISGLAMSFSTFRRVKYNASLNTCKKDNTCILLIKMLQQINVQIHNKCSTMYFKVNHRFHNCSQQKKLLFYCNRLTVNVNVNLVVS